MGVLSDSLFGLSRTLDDPDQPAGNEALQFAGDSGPTLVGKGPSSSRVRESPFTGEVNTLLDTRPELALHKGGYATPNGMGDDMQSMNPKSDAASPSSPRRLSIATLLLLIAAAAIALAAIVRPSWLAANAILASSSYRSPSR